VVDLVRLISILAVLAVHLATAAVARAPGSAHLAGAWQDFARNGSYGVSLFFVVSGLVITRTILRRGTDLARLDLRGFYLRRAGRILPLFLAVVGLGAGALALVGEAGPRAAFCLRDPTARFDGPFWASLATFSFNWLRISRESEGYGFGVHWDVLWSLAIEEQFYLAYPLLLRVLARRGRITAALLCVMASGPAFRAWAGAAHPRSFLLGFTASFACFDLLALGALLGFALDGREQAPPGARRAGEAALGLLGLAGAVFAYRQTALVSPADRVWGPSLLGLGLAAFLYAGIRLGWASSPLAAKLTVPGQWTYGAYLLHATTLFLLWPALAGRPVLAGFAVYALVTLALAGAVYAGFESPVNRWWRRRLAAA
jgi:peptidoglycan/LPS O-acetylase OafA/YrhL